MLNIVRWKLKWHTPVSMDASAHAIFVPCLSCTSVLYYSLFFWRIKTVGKPLSDEIPLNIHTNMQLSWINILSYLNYRTIVDFIEGLNVKNIFKYISFSWIFSMLWILTICNYHRQCRNVTIQSASAHYSFEKSFRLIIIIK